MTVRTRLLFVSVVLLLAGACFFKFDNPVAVQPLGSIGGQLALTGALPQQTLAGASVNLQWSGLSVTVDQNEGPNKGRFLFVDLPAGTFTLRYDVPPIAGNDFPLIGFRHDLFLPGAEGQSDAVNLGTLTITPSGRVTGTISGADGGTVVVGAFTPVQPDGGGGAFEGFTAVADSAGHYSLLLPAGNHDIACSSTSAAGGQPLTLHATEDAGLDLSLTSGTATTSSVTGFLVFGDLGVNAAAASVAPRLPNVTSIVSDEHGAGVSSGPLNPASQVAGAGASFEQTLPPGHNYTVTLSLDGQPNPGSPDWFPPLVLHNIPGVAGRVDRLGQVAWLQQKAFGDNLGDGGGGPAWQLVDSMPPQGALPIIELLPLPLGNGFGGIVGHRLAWVDNQGAVYTADDTASGGTTYGAAQVIWPDGGGVHALAGTATPSGGAAIGWAEQSPGGVTVAYYPPASGALALQTFTPTTPPSNTASGLAMSPGFNAVTAGLWVLVPAQVNSSPLVEFWFTSDFNTYTKVTPAGAPLFDGGSAGLYAGQLVAAPCTLAELDGGSGLCIGATVNYNPMQVAGSYGNWAIGAVLDTNQVPPVLSQQLLFDAGYDVNGGLGGPVLDVAPADGGPSSVALGWTYTNGVAPFSFSLCQFSTLATVPTVRPLKPPLGDPAAEGLLFQWQGEPLAVYPLVNHAPYGVGGIPAGGGVPPAFLPGFGAPQQLHGYAASNGDIFVGAYDNVTVGTTTKLGLFRLPANP
jgi:hypothetical protein